MNKRALPIKMQSILNTILYANIASCGNDHKPLSTPVFICIDDNLTMYWSSDRLSNHSRAIRENPFIALTIYDSSVPEGEGVAFYAAGAASELTAEADILKAMNTYRSSYFAHDVSTWSANAPQRLYAFTPENIWTNGGGKRSGAYIDLRKKLKVLASNTR